MRINSIDNSQNFKARIKLNKPNLKKLGENIVGGSTVAGIGSTAVASLAAQTDFDAAVSQAASPSCAYKGSTLQLINRLNDGQNNFDQSFGVSLSAPLSLQSSGFSGSKILDTVAGGRISEIIDNLNIEKSKEVISLNAASSIIAGINASEHMNADNIATIATTSVPVASMDVTALAEAYEKTEENRKNPS